MTETSGPEGSASDTGANKGTPEAAGNVSPWYWAAFVLPFVVYMLIGSLEPSPPETPPPAAADSEKARPYYPPQPTGFFSYEAYPYVYTAKIVLVLATIVLVSGGYREFLPFRISWLSVAVGVVGVVLWVGICQLQLEAKILGPIDRTLGSLLPTEEGQEPTVGLMSIIGAGERPAFNPLKYLADTPVWAYVFLAIRFTGLAVIVPIIEEFFLRGFIMRYAVHPNFWTVPFGQVDRTAVIIGTALPMLMHPGELLASLVWFSMVTWLMVRTRNIWDCIIAHAVTNFLLGVYVVTTGNWQLM